MPPLVTLLLLCPRRSSHDTTHVIHRRVWWSIHASQRATHLRRLARPHCDACRYIQPGRNLSPCVGLGMSPGLCVGLGRRSCVCDSVWGCPQCRRISTMPASLIERTCVGAFRVQVHRSRTPSLTLAQPKIDGSRRRSTAASRRDQRIPTSGCASSYRPFATTRSAPLVCPRMPLLCASVHAVHLFFAHEDTMSWGVS